MTGKCKKRVTWEGRLCTVAAYVQEDEIITKATAHLPRNSEDAVRKFGDKELREKIESGLIAVVDDICGQIS